MESRVQQYLDEVSQLHSNSAISLVSVILFGSAASGAFSQSSDVDLIIVIPDETSPEDRRHLRAEATGPQIAIVPAPDESTQAQPPPAASA